MTTWIKCSDRQPEPDQVVLIYTPGNKAIETAWHQDMKFGTFWFYPENNGWHEYEVSHWMPLPEPPTEASE